MLLPQHPGVIPGSAPGPSPRLLSISRLGPGPLPLPGTVFSRHLPGRTVSCGVGAGWWVTWEARQVLSEHLWGGRRAHLHGAQVWPVSLVTQGHPGSLGAGETATCADET